MKYYFVTITKENEAIYFNLATAYEAEFSNLTNKMPDENGLFQPDSLPEKPNEGILMYYDDKPCGFCIANITDEMNDIREFYIIPSCRRRQLGGHLADYTFKEFPGAWQVRQIQGADDARKFWRAVVNKVTNGNYQETKEHDDFWGTVSCQRFVIHSK